ncbi:Ferrochelatase [Roseimaritima ulvae]|uniref:coproporphyrin ferrochelatase n=2 Tax=Roseimaritima ulvae TaxID=980254 RepID=A0A5B9QS26_9BACT|nr:Ferrochelatase [Roseimaritima ulvae]
MPFLENVLRGKRVPRERMLEVAEHYKHFGGVSPINEQNRALIAALGEQFSRDGIDLPIYWGNRNWSPLLPEALQQIAGDGKRRVLAFFTSMYSSYSGCRQYRENIQQAQAEVGPQAPQVDKLRFGFNHPGFVGPMAENVRASLQSLDADVSTPVLFTAHSIPLAMADNCSYQRQLEESCRLVAESLGLTNWQLVYQSRSGPPQQPWLEPDVCDTIAAMDDDQKLESLVIAPVGFISDHMEVIYDLDDEAATLCRQRSIHMARSSTVGTHPDFVAMIAELVRERMTDDVPRRALGDLGPWHDVCPLDCCLYKPTRP